ncbi:TPA: DUF3592 domain-containing protein [Vibrio vulnificus]
MEIELIPLLGGVIFLSAGFFVIIEHTRFMKNATKTKAKVIGYKEIRRKDKGRTVTSFAPIFVFTVDGVQYESCSHISFSSKRYLVGMQIEIAYIKGKYSEARIASNTGIPTAVLFILLSLPALYFGFDLGFSVK